MNIIIRFLKKYYQIVVLIFLLFAFGCQNPVGNELNDEAQKEIVQEISMLMHAYSHAVKNGDSDAIDSFWGDFEGFIFAGDGIILGGHKEWSELLRQYDEQVERWLKFQYRNMHIEVLSKNAVTVTSEFELSRITVIGDTIDTKGAWTYVFKRFNGEWDVVQTNGTHVEF